jgi:hypothetical protein
MPDAVADDKPGAGQTGGQGLAGAQRDHRIVVGVDDQRGAAQGGQLRAQVGLGQLAQALGQRGGQRVGRARQVHGRGPGVAVAGGAQAEKALERAGHIVAQGPAERAHLAGGQAVDPVGSEGEARGRVDQDEAGDRRRLGQRGGEGELAAEGPAEEVGGVGGWANGD